MDNRNIDYVLPVVKEEKEDVEKRIRKRKIIALSIISVIVLTIICVVLSFVFPKSISGSWELIENPEVTQSTPDEIKDSDRVYYTFTKPGEYGDGKWTTYFNGGVEEGDYKLSEKQGKEYIDMGTGEFEYVIKGSKLLGNAKISIIYPESTNEETGETTPAQQYVLKQARTPRYNDDSYDKYQIDNNLLGGWVTNERSLAYFYYNIPYTQTVNFNDNGVMIIHYESEELALDRFMYYAYTTNDNKLTFSLVTDKETNFEVAYEIDKDGNLKFIDDTTSSSIFADAFFGEATFYTPENLPEPSQATGDELLAE